MSFDLESVFTKSVEAAAGAFADQWDNIKGFVGVELKKLSVQLVEIADNVARFQVDPSQGYPAETGRVLLQMQRNSLEAVITAMTALTIIAVQQAIDAILRVLKDAFKSTLGSIIS